MDQSWDEFLTFDSELINNAPVPQNFYGAVPQDFDFFFDAHDNQFSPAISGSSGSFDSPAQPLTPVNSGMPASSNGGDITFNDNQTLAFLGQESTLPYLNPAGAAHGSNYVDFNLFSPASSFIDEEPQKLKAGDKRKASALQAASEPSIGVQAPHTGGIDAGSRPSSGEALSAHGLAHAGQWRFDHSESGTSTGSPQGHEWQVPAAQRQQDGQAGDGRDSYLQSVSIGNQRSSHADNTGRSSGHAATATSIIAHSLPILQQSRHSSVTAAALLEEGRETSNSRAPGSPGQATATIAPVSPPPSSQVVLGPRAYGVQQDNVVPTVGSAHIEQWTISPPVRIPSCLIPAVELLFANFRKGNPRTISSSWHATPKHLDTGQRSIVISRCRIRSCNYCNRSEPTGRARCPAQTTTSWWTITNCWWTAIDRRTPPRTVIDRFRRRQCLQPDCAHRTGFSRDRLDPRTRIWTPPRRRGPPSRRGTFPHSRCFLILAISIRSRRLGLIPKGNQPWPGPTTNTARHRHRPSGEHERRQQPPTASPQGERCTNPPGATIAGRLDVVPTGRIRICYLPAVDNGFHLVRTTLANATKSTAYLCSPHKYIDCLPLSSVAVGSTQFALQERCPRQCHEFVPPRDIVSTMSRRTRPGRLGSRGYGLLLRTLKRLTERYEDDVSWTRPGSDLGCVLFSLSHVVSAILVIPIFLFLAWSRKQ